MRIATVQCSAVPDDAAATCDMVVRRLRWADEQAVDLVLFPEAFLLGHSYDPQTIRSRAQAASSHSLAGLCGHVARFRATLVIGAFALSGERTVNSAFVIAGGGIVGRYDKAYPNEPGVAAGSDFPTFLKAGTRYGINICNDANHADVARRIADQHAALILYPLNNLLPQETAERWREKSLENLKDRARDTGCWVASSDVTGASGDLVSFGCTAIVAPDGRVMARVPEMSEGVAVYDVPARPVSRVPGGVSVSRRARQEPATG